MRVITALIALALVLPPAPAAADDDLVVAVGLRYVPDVVTVEAGGTLDLFNADPLSLTDGHDVTHSVSPSARLFASDTVLVGTITPVRGVDALATGLYPFHCTRHPSMTGTLQVIVTDQ